MLPPFCATTRRRRSFRRRAAACSTARRRPGSVVVTRRAPSGSAAAATAASAGGRVGTRAGLHRRSAPRRRRLAWCRRCRDRYCGSRRCRHGCGRRPVAAAHPGTALSFRPCGRGQFTIAPLRRHSTPLKDGLGEPGPRPLLRWHDQSSCLALSRSRMPGWSARSRGHEALGPSAPDSQGIRYAVSKLVIRREKLWRHTSEEKTLPLRWSGHPLRFAASTFHAEPFC